MKHLATKGAREVAGAVFIHLSYAQPLPCPSPGESQRLHGSDLNYCPSLPWCLQLRPSLLLAAKWGRANTATGGSLGAPTFPRELQLSLEVSTLPFPGVLSKSLAGLGASLQASLAPRSCPGRVLGPAFCHPGVLSAWQSAQHTTGT